MGGPNACSITAALFLAEFVDGLRSWAHIDIAGTAHAVLVRTWRNKGRHRVRHTLVDRAGQQLHHSGALTDDDGGRNPTTLASGATATKPGSSEGQEDSAQGHREHREQGPHPGDHLLRVCVLVIVLSAILLLDVWVTYEVAEGPEGITDEIERGTQYPGTLPDPDEAAIYTAKTTAIQSLLSVDGIRFLFTSLVSNFSSFSVVAVILVAMIGVGVAEEAGLMGALIRKLVQVAPAWAITGLSFRRHASSVASDAGYLILIRWPRRPITVWADIRWPGWPRRTPGSPAASRSTS